MVVDGVGWWWVEVVGGPLRPQQATEASSRAQILAQLPKTNPHLYELYHVQCSIKKDDVSIIAVFEYSALHARGRFYFSMLWAAHRSDERLWPLGT